MLPLILLVFFQIFLFSNKWKIIFKNKAQKKKENKKVLVHCAAGISRSSTVTLAYLVRFEQLNLKDAYKILREARRVANPNYAFWEILEEWEKEYAPNKN